MTELEDGIIKPLIADGSTKFCSRFVYDTLMVVKPENVSQVHKSTPVKDLLRGMHLLIQ